MKYTPSSDLYLFAPLLLKIQHLHQAYILTTSTSVWWSHIVLENVFFFQKQSFMHWCGSLFVDCNTTVQQKFLHKSIVFSLLGDLSFLYFLPFSSQTYFHLSCDKLWHIFVAQGQCEPLELFESQEKSTLEMQSCTWGSKPALVLMHSLKCMILLSLLAWNLIFDIIHDCALALNIFYIANYSLCFWLFQCVDVEHIFLFKFAASCGDLKKKHAFVWWV